MLYLFRYISKLIVQRIMLLLNTGLPFHLVLELWVSYFLCGEDITQWWVSTSDVSSSSEICFTAFWCFFSCSLLLSSHGGFFTSFLPKISLRNKFWSVCFSPFWMQYFLVWVTIWCSTDYTSHLYLRFESKKYDYSHLRSQMDEGGHRENGRHKADPYKAVHSQVSKSVNLCR